MEQHCLSICAWSCCWVADWSLLQQHCVQRLVFSGAHLLMCVLLLFCGISLRRSSPHRTRFKAIRLSSWFWVTPFLTGTVTCIHVANAARRILVGESSSVIFFSILQFVTWASFSGVVMYEKALALHIHATFLRLTWIVNFVISGMMAVVASFEWGDSGGELSADDAIAIVTVAVSSFLFVVAVMGRTGISVMESEPLVGGERNCNGKVGDEEETDRVTAFEKAGILSKLSFLWLNPVLATGRSRTIQLADIPLLRKEDRVEASHAAFEVQWEKRTGSKTVILPLILSFWPLFVLSGILGLMQLSVLYVGPLLIQQFIDVAAQTDRAWSRGAYLVLELFAAKVVEVVARHQYSFYCQKLGNDVRGALITAVYQKGLRITSSARQSHGTGKIVNYMSVDSQEVCYVLTQIHDLWILPIQISLALVILYGVVGMATLAGVGTLVGVMAVTLSLAVKQQALQMKIMEHKDNRIKVTSEVLSSMKIIKLCAWQDEFLKRVELARASEREWIVKLMYLAATSIFFLWLSPLAVSVLTFGTCVLLHIDLTAGKVFTAIATFRILQEPLRALPQMIMSAAQAYVSAKRLSAYLDSAELNPAAVERRPPGRDMAVIIKDGIFKWEAEAERSNLSNINVEVRAGSLVAIVGLVGSGKSAFLSCVLGEMEKVRGSVSISGTVAYVAQTAWIQNGTIQENIMFGKPLDTDRYNETLKVCALEGDLIQMIHGDQTEIGERGINVSGGQKQRIQLARAVYQDADVYLLDDVFSAVDAHTGTELFKDCVRGALSGKTVLLVTHQVEFLRGADLILVMRDGEIVQAGKYDELTSQGTDFSALVKAHNESLESADSSGEVDSEVDNDAVPDMEDTIASSWISDAQARHPSPVQQASSQLSCRHGTSPGLSNSPTPGMSRENSLDRQIASKKMPGRPGSGKHAAKVPPEPSSRLIEDEERAKGQVDFAVYQAYLTKIFYGSHVVLLILIQTCWQGLQIASDFWLATSTSDVSQQSFQPKRFITVYAELAIGSSLFVLARSFLVSFCGIRTAQKFFLDMVRSVFRSPMSFFDTTPSGRILSRSSTDQMSLDFILPFMFGTFLAIGFQLVGALVVVARVTPQMIFVIIPLAGLYVWYQLYFIATSRELTRLESITEAPIIHHFSESISGFATIRAFGHQERFSMRNANLVDTNIRIQFHNFASSEWLGFRLEMIGTIILCTSALLLVSLPSSLVQPELVGLSLSYGLALNACLFWVVLSLCQIELRMVSVERVLQYTGLPSEAPLVIDDNRPHSDWPQHGNISMQQLQLRYRPDTPLVLKGVTFFVKGGEKLGVVGRTGSGKSSLIQALFRLVEPCGGKIFVDGIDVTKIGLMDLRSKFSIIPQEPTLFQGSVRMNLDPLAVHSDAEIWEALEKCQLSDMVKEKNEKLDFVVAENGENWSMGQRQLFCLGRALLKRSRILVLDEATASVDTLTDAVLQKTISREFADCTVISIAHRIPSVMDSDKVLVMDGGVVQEFGSPSSLLEKPSLFASLVHEYWNRSSSMQNLREAA